MEKLRYRMIRTVFISVVIVFLAISFILYFALVSYNITQTDGMTTLISLNNYKVPQLQEYKNFNYGDKLPFHINFDEETAESTRYFIVYLDDSERVVHLNLDHINAVSSSQASGMAKRVLNRKGTTGYVSNYRYRLVSDHEKNGYSVIFLDCSEYLFFQNTAIFFLLLIALVFTILITTIFSIFSKKIMNPFEKNSARQKQFITDASHELKTPLAIISANAQVLQYKDGENDWTKNIILQTERMGKLINELLTLSKMDELDQALVLEKVDYCEIIKQTIEPFQEIVEEKQAVIKLGLPEQVTFLANKEQLSNLVSILTENATKYVTEQGKITISLSANKRFATLKIFNTAQMPEDFECERLFDRFYRPDSSRTSATGGYGIGLSIAKKITTQMGGNIQARVQSDGICFTATVATNMKMPKKKKGKKKRRNKKNESKEKK